jgi:Cu(I)/Ag(I) efflux system membrane protein CusA/SilA
MLSRYGVSIGELQDIIEVAIGGQNLGVVLEGRMRFPIRLRFEREYRDNVDELKRLFIPVRTNVAASAAMNASPAMGQSGTSSTSSGMTGMGSAQSSKSQVSSQQSSFVSSSLLDQQSASELAYVPLSELADLKIITGPPMISSENGQLRAIVYMNVRGRDMGGTMEDAKKIISDNLKLPPGYSYTWSGQYEHKVRAQRTLTYIMPIVFLIVFVLLYFTFKDYVEAFVVMLSVPFALIGGVYMIYILGYNFSVAVWVGFIALYGIAVETGVVMVVYLHEALDKKIRAHKKGERGPLTSQDIYDATVEGAVLRLRPKIMTVVTSMMGLIPVMWATGAGADMMKPLTAPMIGGLFTSAVHVLVVTPVLFVIMKEHALKKGTLELSRMAEFIKEEE